MEVELIFLERRPDISGGGVYVCGGEDRNLRRGGLIFVEGRAEIVEGS